MSWPTDHHGWAELLAPRQATAALEGPHRTPWVVIGAGLTGLACARRLAERHPDDEILLLEARAVGQGASGRNSGFVVATSHFPGGVVEADIDNYRRVNRINQAGLELLDETIEAQAIDCLWQRDGFIHTAAGDAALREHPRFVNYLQRLEVAHESLDRDQLSALLGSSLYRAGVKIGDGALVQPAALVRGLAAALPDNVRLCEHSPVVELVSGQTQRLRLARAEVETDRVILATNYEAPRLGLLRNRIVGSTLAGSFTRPLTPDERAGLGSLSEWGAISLHGGGATLRLTRDGRISIRNTAEYHGSALLSDSELARRQAIHRAAFDPRPGVFELDVGQLREAAIERRAMDRLPPSELALAE